MTSNLRPTNGEKFVDFQLLNEENGGFVASGSFGGSQVVV
jgi:hypothetical protein